RVVSGPATVLVRGKVSGARPRQRGESLVALADYGDDGACRDRGLDELDQPPGNAATTGCLPLLGVEVQPLVRMCDRIRVPVIRRVLPLGADLRVVDERDPELPTRPRVDEVEADQTVARPCQEVRVRAGPRPRRRPELRRQQNAAVREEAAGAP